MGREARASAATVRPPSEQPQPPLPLTLTLSPPEIGFLIEALTSEREACELVARRVPAATAGAQQRIDVAAFLAAKLRGALEKAAAEARPGG